MRVYKEDNSLRVYVDCTQEERVKLFKVLINEFYYDVDISTLEDPLMLFFVDNNRVFYPEGINLLCEGFLRRVDPNLVIDYESTQQSLQPVSISCDILEGRTLRDYQVLCVNNALTYKRGLTAAVTGSGKTSMILAIVKYLLETTDKNVIVTVPTVVLLNQTYQDALNVGIPEDSITLMGDGNQVDYSKRVLFTTMASAYISFCKSCLKETQKFLDNTCALLVDECSHMSAQTWSKVIDKLSCEYILGFSAEPFYGDQNNRVRDLLLRGLCGPVLTRVGYDQLIKEGYLSKPYYVRVPTECKQSSIIFRCMNWQTIRKIGIIENPYRNSLIIDIAKYLVYIKKKPLILIDVIRHGEQLAIDISSQGLAVALCTGGNTCRIFRDGKEIDSHNDFDKVKFEFKEGFIDILIGSSALDEGVDLSIIGSIILAGGGKAKLKLIQRIGRSVRVDPDDPYKISFIIDFIDAWSIVSRSQSNKRYALYSDNNFQGVTLNRSEDYPKAIETILEHRKSELNER